MKHIIGSDEIIYIISKRPLAELIKDYGNNNNKILLNDGPEEDIKDRESKPKDKKDLIVDELQDIKEDNPEPKAFEMSFDLESIEISDDQSKTIENNIMEQVEEDNVWIPSTFPQNNTTTNHSTTTLETSSVLDISIDDVLSELENSQDKNDGDDTDGTATINISNNSNTFETNDMLELFSEKEENNSVIINEDSEFKDDSITAGYFSKITPGIKKEKNEEK